MVDGPVIRDSDNQQAMIDKLVRNYEKKTAQVVGKEQLEVAQKVLSGNFSNMEEVRLLTQPQAKAIQTYLNRDGKEPVSDKTIKATPENPAVKDTRQQIISEFARQALQMRRAAPAA